HPDKPHNHHLHSFPTRRSSDLAIRCPDSPQAAVAAGQVRIPEPGANEEPVADERTVVREDLADTHRMAEACHTGTHESATGSSRSEEHTSELRSRSDLVCRLLL